MRGPSVALWLFLALRTALSGMEVRWCSTSDPEQQKCSDMSKAFQGAGIQPSLRCVQGASADHCIQLIMAGEADAITLDGGAIYEAGKEHGLKPVVGEVYDQEVGTSYYAVAVVKRSSNLTITTLKGVKSCHTGINRTVGWNVPVGYLVESGSLSVMGCDVLRAVSEYFGGSCVPGAGETSYSKSLCRLCRGNAAGEGVCDKSPLERYYDYSGAFRCLAEGAGDVAFVKHSTVLENTDGKTLPSWGQALLSQDFQLLCLDGSRADVTEWRHCHLAQVPAHAVVVRADTDGGLIFRLLNEGQRLFSHENSSFQMFSSEAYGQKNLLFKDATSELVPIATQTYEAWLGPEYLRAMKGLLCDSNRLPRYLHWCVLSTPEIQKCGDMAVAFSRQRLRPEIQCVSAESPQHCMERIQAGQIDAVTLRGEDIYTAGKAYGLVPAAGEQYAPEDRSNSYFVVAVVKRNSSDAFSLNELRGKRSCHSALGSPAGWDIPVGALVRRGFIQPRDCDVLTAVSEFFSASCVPVNNPGRYPSSLCALCVGDEQGRNKCVGNSQERYFGYRGAFRCLAENAGDVAFVKHTTVFDNTDGHNSEPWAAELRSEDYELLCPNGARAEVFQFKDCNLAQMPAHAVMVRPDTNIFAVYGLLDKAQLDHSHAAISTIFKKKQKTSLGLTSLCSHNPTALYSKTPSKRCLCSGATTPPLLGSLKDGDYSTPAHPARNRPGRGHRDPGGYVQWPFRSLISLTSPQHWGLFGDDHNKNGFKMFDSSDYHGQDLLFKDATIRAEPVRERTTYLEWLGPDYVAALEGMLAQQCSRAASDIRRNPQLGRIPLYILYCGQLRDEAKGLVTYQVGHS
ncbi:PREDICTED: melanotransferrin [Myotis brandtii]|uniref:melanotransferrin n=1 Tax=Myotis brandtii TaxID=109478 RepID=UPI00070412B7|nr:PREDICTED: melanotransferrin [Myotis brandtii]